MEEMWLAVDQNLPTNLHYGMFIPTILRFNLPFLVKLLKLTSRSVKHLTNNKVNGYLWHFLLRFMEPMLRLS